MAEKHAASAVDEDEGVLGAVSANANDPEYVEFFCDAQDEIRRVAMHIIREQFSKDFVMAIRGRLGREAGAHTFPLLHR